MRRTVHALCARAVASEVTPGGVVAVADGDRTILSMAFGTTHPGGPAVRDDTVYDVASLTKAVATGGVLARLLASGHLDLDDRAVDLVPALTCPGADAITVRHLAGHGSGLPAHIELFQRLRAGERAGAVTAREALVAMAGATPLAHPPGERAVYSDLGYLLLAAALERAGGDRLDRLFGRLIAAPLDLSSSFFVDVEAGARAPAELTIAPTEHCPVRGRLHGEVHDDNAHAGGGVCGHAGLFSTATDLLRFARAYNAAGRGETGLFDPEVVRTLTRTSAAPDTTWRLGWDTPAPAPGVSHAGDRWSRDSGFGHLGFTGCSLWLDPPRGRAVVLLTNRVHRGRDKPGIKELRRAVMDAVCDALPS